MTKRKFIIQKSGDLPSSISITSKDPKDVFKLEHLMRKIFHNEHIVGATINYSNGHTVRIDMEQQ